MQDIDNLDVHNESDAEKLYLCMETLGIQLSTLKLI